MTIAEPPVGLNVSEAMDYIRGNLPYLPPGEESILRDMLQRGLAVLEERPADLRLDDWNSSLERLVAIWRQNGADYLGALEYERSQLYALPPTDPEEVRALKDIKACIWPFCP